MPVFLCFFDCRRNFKSDVGEFFVDWDSRLTQVFGQAEVVQEQGGRRQGILFLGCGEYSGRQEEEEPWRVISMSSGCGKFSCNSN